MNTGKPQKGCFLVFFQKKIHPGRTHQLTTLINPPLTPGKEESPHPYNDQVRELPQLKQSTLMRKKNFDVKDIQILNHFNDEGVLTARELAGRVNISPGPMSNRLKALRRKGVLAGSKAVLHYPSLGYRFSRTLLLCFPSDDVPAIIRQAEGGRLVIGLWVLKTDPQAPVSWVCAHLSGKSDEDLAQGENALTGSETPLLRVYFDSTEKVIDRNVTLTLQDVQ